MNTLDDALELWKTADEKSVYSFNNEDVLHIIKLRIKNQKNIIARYAFASWLWQFIFYALAVNTVIRVGGNLTFLVISLAGIGLYIPFTVAYAKFCSRMIKNASKRGASAESVANDLKNHFGNLNRFYSFKKKFDFIGIPVTGTFIVMVLIALNVIPSISIDPIPGLIAFIFYFLAFIAATYYENRKRFLNPLKQMNTILKELGE